MPTHFTDHVRERMAQRGATEDEVEEAIALGGQVPDRQNRVKFTQHFPFNRVWRGTRYRFKKVEVIAVWDGDGWTAITVIVSYIA